MSWFRPISISLSPNTQQDDVLLAFQLLFQFSKWIKTSPVRQLENAFSEYLSIPNAVAFNSGRSAMMAILHSLNFEKGDEVLVQAFTCNAVPNPILWEGLKPVYVDCNIGDFNMSVEDLRQKITKKSRAVVVQHTFGLPADLDAIDKVCQENNLILIEDCAHALGATYKGRLVGTFGAAAFFSFSRDKVISSVYGGMAVAKDKELAERIKTYWEKIDNPPFFWTFQQLLHPVLMNWIVLPTYSILGKYLLVVFQKMHILSRAIHKKEKQGEKPSYFPKRLPPPLALLALRQFLKLEQFNAHRKDIAEFYIKELNNTPFQLPERIAQRSSMHLRFPVRHKNAHEIIKKSWKQNILLGDWYTCPIAPEDTNTELLGYEAGKYPNAEILSRETLNLPTAINISKKDAKKVISFLKKNAD